MCILLVYVFFLHVFIFLCFLWFYGSLWTDLINEWMNEWITVQSTGEIVVSSRLNKFSQARVTLSDMTTDKTMCATSCRFSWCETGFRAKRYWLLNCQKAAEIWGLHAVEHIFVYFYCWTRPLLSLHFSFHFL